MVSHTHDNNMDDLTTCDGLAAALDEAGSWAKVSRQTGVPASTLKSRAKRLGVKVEARQSDRNPNGHESSQCSPAMELPESYFEAMLEFLLNSGFSGYPAHGGMLEFASDLGLDQKMMFQLANKAAELAGEEYNRLTDELWQVWNEWAA